MCPSRRPTRLAYSTGRTSRLRRARLSRYYPELTPATRDDPRSDHPRRIARAGALYVFAGLSGGRGRVAHPRALGRARLLPWGACLSRRGVARVAWPLPPTTALCVCGEVHLTFPSPSVRCATSLGSNSPPREGYAIDLAPPPRRRGLLTAPGRRRRNAPPRRNHRRAPPRRSRQREPLPRCVASVSALRAQTGAPGWSGVTARAPSREV